MSRVGILSINLHSFYLNYGAALHSFAFQKYLDSKDIDSVIVDYKSKHFGNFKLDNPALSCLQRKEKMKTILHSLICTPSFRRKYKAFNQFYKKNCKILDNYGKPFTYDDFNNNPTLKFDFSIVVCESDVIWSPKTSKGFDRVFFCDYSCFKDKVKVAYAPSISNTELNPEEELEFKYLLKNFDYLSCREKITAEYVSEISDRHCEHVLDPVLLHNGEFYEQYMEPLEQEKYFLVYNVTSNDQTMISTAKKIAKKKRLKFIEISNFVRNKFNHYTLTDSSLGEFLWLIRNAEYFVTNGFHGLCFAILFEKQFVIYERDGFDIKVKSLLSVLGLENKFCLKQFDDFKYIENILEEGINWKEIQYKLKLQRDISYDFIEKSIIENI